MAARERKHADIGEARNLLASFADPADLDWLVAHPDAVLAALGSRLRLFSETLVRTVQRVPAIRDAAAAACDAALVDIQKELDALADKDAGLHGLQVQSNWCAYDEARVALRELVPCSADGCANLAAPPGEYFERRPAVTVVTAVCEEHARPDAVTPLTENLSDLKQRAGEDLFHYYLRVDDPLAEAFKSIHSVAWTGSSVEAEFDPAAPSFRADWQAFADAGLDAAIVPMQTSPDENTRELSLYIQHAGKEQDEDARPERMNPAQALLFVLKQLLDGKVPGFDPNAYLLVAADYGSLQDRDTSIPTTVASLRELNYKTVQYALLGVEQLLAAPEAPQTDMGPFRLLKDLLERADNDDEDEVAANAEPKRVSVLFTPAELDNLLCILEDTFRCSSDVDEVIAAKELYNKLKPAATHL